MNEFGETCPITFPVGSIGAHNPMLGFVPENGVIGDIPIPGSDSGGSQGQIEALTAFGQFIGCFLDFFRNRSIPLQQQSENERKENGAPNPSHKGKIGQGFLGPVAEALVTYQVMDRSAPALTVRVVTEYRASGMGFADDFTQGSPGPPISLKRP